jgi:VWFA-related protein
LSHFGTRSAALFAVVLRLIVAGVSQDAQQQPPHARTKNPNESVATFQSNTRMVTLEVVAKDSQGRHVTGLKAGDFQVLEQVPSRGKDKHEQKIAAFREVRIAELASRARNGERIPPGVYANTFPLQKDPVPLTILLVDGLNTDLKYQAQVHVQMLRMLRSLPANVPVAVFLFGRRLQMLQNFTTDPRLLQAALDKAISAAGTGVARLDPRDDPNALSALFDQINGPALVTPPSSPQPGSGNEEVKAIPQAIVDAVKRFEQETYASSMDMRVQQTIDALLSLGRHVAGYPGRKNLLWISTSFPIYLSPLVDDTGKPITEITGLNSTGIRNYWRPLQMLASVLSEAKVAVYPINPAGVEVPALYEAGTRPRDYGGRKAGESLSRETVVRSNEQDTMRVIAEGTGGEVCTGNNDLADCVRKAVDDSGSFYEIAYYPDSQSWNGEYRKIIVKTREPGLHLAYRQGYFARTEGGGDSQDQKVELQQAACEDYLNSTSIAFSAKSLPPDSPANLKFYLTIDASALTLTPTSNGGRDLNMIVAVCTFDRKGEPFTFMSDTIQRQFDASEYLSLTAHGLPHIVSVPGPKPPSLRLLIKDVPSGRLGSVSIKVEDIVAAHPDNHETEPAEVH